ncbi:MAG TPA: hypothetical protein PLT64_08940 [Syntrophales bacterium]|nr:hypothetical protein [Syntrophales bacterium]HOL59968.1 hypothetical protein [Syntrophales bacterium]HPO36119.1 hypothetical protein [Syntrophales bacterium]
MEEMKEGHRIIDLVDVVEEAEGREEKKTTARVAVVNTSLQAEMLKKVEETAERVAREMFPAIAERIIREEIEKLKKQ